MTEATTGKVTAPAGGTTGPADKLVPEKDLLALKGSLTRQLEQAKAEAEKARSEVAELRAKEKEAKESSALEGLTDVDQLRVLRKQTLKDRMELEKREKALAEKESELGKLSIESAKRKIATELGVPPEVVADATTEEQAELMARRHLAGKPAQGAQPQVDLGRGGGAAGATLTPHERIKRGLEAAHK